MTKPDKSYNRPTSPVEKWAKAQAARWIRSAVKSGNAEFQYSSHATQREAERNVSPEDALDCIACGTAIDWESGFDRNSQKPDMRMKFEQNKRTRTIAVVAAVSNYQPGVVVVTLMSNPRRS